ncbi:hypothetical protein LCGC14_2713320, partial [marine sediment metagenome]
VFMISVKYRCNFGAEDVFFADAEFDEYVIHERRDEQRHHEPECENNKYSYRFKKFHYIRF